MFGIGTPELILILVIALVVIGPKHLPEMAKALGKGLGEFKKATNELKETINADDDLREISKSLSEAKDEVYGTIKKGMTDLDEIKETTDSMTKVNLFSDDDEKTQKEPDPEKKLAEAEEAFKAEALAEAKAELMSGPEEESESREEIKSTDKTDE
ncbi:MAG: twin-arginine translocase TatA/TatE family subunit [Candidatus Adiutricales bacterium]